MIDNESLDVALKYPGNDIDPDDENMYMGFERVVGFVEYTHPDFLDIMENLNITTLKICKGNEIPFMSGALLSQRFCGDDAFVIATFGMRPDNRLFLSVDVVAHDNATLMNVFFDMKRMVHQ